MYIKYGFLADTITFDSIGKANAIGIFEVIYAQNFPAIQRDMCLLVNLEGTEGEKGEHTISIELRDRDGNRQIPPLEQTIKMINLSKLHGVVRAGVVLKLMDTPFPKAGQYEFVVFADGRFVGRVTFNVQKVISTPPAQDA